jgi:hypothetical protein
MLANMRMYGHVAPVFERELHVQHLVRILGGVVFHRAHEGLSVAAIVGIVMAEILADAALVGLSDFAGADET